MMFDFFSILMFVLLCKMYQAPEGNSQSGISQLRLLGGPDRCQGRVEVSYSNKNGTVCPRKWEIQEAAVVCNQLGCGPVKEATTRPLFGPGSGPDCLDNIDCYGTEKHVSHCDTNAFEWTKADHSWDAAVICLQTTITDIRLENGSHKCEGRVEVLLDNKWGTVCANEWGMEEAAVVCKQIGCGTAQEAPGSSRFGPGTDSMLLESYYCSGSERSLAECSSILVDADSPSCDHQRVAGVICNQKAEITNVNLVNGSTRCNGRVEIKYNSVTGTISHYQWDQDDAEVVCREVGCGHAQFVEKHASFGQGSGPIFLKAVYCNGSEERISHCSAVISNHHEASHAEDVGVICSEREGELYNSLIIMALKLIVCGCTFSGIHIIYNRTADVKKNKHGDEMEMTQVEPSTTDIEAQN